MKIGILLIAAAVLAIVVPASADTLYSNGANTQIEPFGTPNTTTYGELFNAPMDGDSQLKSFSMFLSPDYGGSIQFAGYVGTWNGTSLGSLLYSSIQATYNQSGTQGFGFVPSLDLTPGGSYVAFLSVTSGYCGSCSNGAFMPTTFSGTVPGGMFVWDNNSGNFASLYSDNWANAGPGYQAEFQADFGSPSLSPTPEPSTFLLLGSGLLGLIFMTRRKIAATQQMC